MQIKCNACDQGLNIPDEKVPKDRAFSLACPGCRAKIRVDQHLDSRAPESPREGPKPEIASQGQAEEIDVSPDTPGLILSTELEDDEEELLIYDENDQIALVLDDAHKDLWVDALEERGFKIQFARSPEYAVHKMKFTRFHLVVLHENYGKVPFHENPVYRLLVEMPMSQRRNIYFVLTGSRFKTLNNMEAFSRSVNAVINEKDMNKLPQILKKSILDNEMFFKVFKESLHAMGKV